MTRKEIGTLTYKITVEDAEESLVQAMDISKDKLEDWRYALNTSGWHDLAKQVEEYIDIIVRAEGDS